MNELGFFRPAIFLANKLEVNVNEFFFLSQTKKKDCLQEKKHVQVFRIPKPKNLHPQKLPSRSLTVRPWKVTETQ